ncbi:MAG: hypothetical protein JNL05_12505 [Flavobacteriales bacterium]|nr:hypothetical protein [Flavobacteriales bacterium]
MTARVWVGVALLLCLGVALGSLREFVFINLNYQVAHAAGQTPWSYAHSAMQRLLVGWSLGDLLRLKWAMALCFVALMGSLTFLTARLLFGRRLDRTVVAGYLAIGTLSLLLHLLGGRLPFTASAGVKLLHLLQYPMPLLVLVVARFMPGERA